MCPQSTTGYSRHTHQHQPPRGSLLFLLQTRMSLRTEAGFCSEPDSPREGVLLQGSGHGNRNLQGPSTLSSPPACTVCYPSSLSTSACISPHFNTPDFLSPARLCKGSKTLQILRFPCTEIPTSKRGHLLCPFKVSGGLGLGPTKAYRLQEAVQSSIFHPLKNTKGTCRKWSVWVDCPDLGLHRDRPIAGKEAA